MTVRKQYSILTKNLVNVIDGQEAGMIYESY
jgi:hypothetical protein